MDNTEEHRAGEEPVSATINCMYIGNDLHMFANPLQWKKRGVSLRAQCCEVLTSTYNCSC